MTSIRSAAAALAASLFLHSGAGSRELVREGYPAQALALSADANGDGFVSREEIADACARAVADAPAAFGRDWKAKLAVYGMPLDAASLDVERIFAATAAIVEGADANGDGRVTAVELRDYVMRFPADQRPDMIQAALALDRDVDLSITREELAAARERFAAEVARIKELSPHVREAMLRPSKAEALETWKSSTGRIADAAIDLWRGAASGGRAAVGDLRAQAPEEAGRADQSPSTAAQARQ